MKRWPQILLIASFLPLCWLLMMVVHELGHAGAAWLTGGTVTKVVLHPLAISRTDVEPNPNGVVVVWGGPVIGVLMPVVFWTVMAFFKAPAVHLWRFWAGFCLVTNGAYIGVGSMGGVGDAGVMLQEGSPLWTLWLFGVLSISTGLGLWHGQGKYFGLGRSASPVDWRVALATLGILVLVAGLEIWLSPGG